MKNQSRLTALLALCLSIATVQGADLVKPPTAGKFFFYDVGAANDERVVQLYKKDGTNVFAVHPSMGDASFYSALYQTNCYTCATPNNYDLGDSGKQKSVSVVPVINN